MVTPAERAMPSRGNRQVAVVVEASRDKLAHRDAARVVLLEAQLLGQVIGERLPLHEVVVPREALAGGEARGSGPSPARILAGAPALGVAHLVGVAAVHRTFARRCARRTGELVGAHRAGVRVGLIRMLGIEPVIVVEKRILLDTLLHVVAQLDRRHLHDFDALAQLGCEAKLLPSLNALTEIHEAPLLPHGPTLFMRRRALRAPPTALRV